MPIGHEVPWSVHGAIVACGVARLDNAPLEPLVRACPAGDPDEFSLAIAPLRVPGGPGSPATPFAVF